MSPLPSFSWMHPQPRRDVGGTGMSGASSHCSHACRGHPALLEREPAVVCVSLTLVTGSDSPQEWSRQCWDLHGASPHGQGCVASISMAMGGRSHPFMLAEVQGFAAEVPGASIPVVPREAFPSWLFCALAGSRSLCSCRNDLQKGHSLRAVPLLPCWMLQGAGTLLKGIFLLCLQNECSCRS